MPCGPQDDRVLDFGGAQHREVPGNHRDRLARRLRECADGPLAPTVSVPKHPVDQAPTSLRPPVRCVMHHGGNELDTGAVGIDLGTSNTVVIVRWPDGRSRPLLFDGQPILPSAVYLDADGTLRVGNDARRMAQIDPGRYEPNPKRRIDDGVLLLGDQQLPIVEVLAALLRTVARAVAETFGHLPPAVLTCPAAWGATRRDILLEAAARAGWTQVRLVSEPVAAARYFTETLRRPVPPGSVLAVFDFGGGTLDVALVRNDGAGTLAVVGTGGAEDIGGLDIDAALVGHLGTLMAEQYPDVWRQISQPTDELGRRHRSAFWDDARAAKETLSRSTVAPIAVPGVSTSLHVTRDELEDLARPLVERAVAELTATLRRAGLATEALAGVFLVGGASRVPLVSRLLHTRLRVAPTMLEQPELPVAEGAVAEAAHAVRLPHQRPTPTQTVPTGPAMFQPPPHGYPGVPTSPMPTSSVPISSVPISSVPISSMPSSSMPSSPMQPMPMAPHPAYPLGPPPPGYRPPPPPPRRSTHRWIIALVLSLLVVSFGGGITAVVWAAKHPPKKPLTNRLKVKTTVSIDGLAPNGFRQSLLNSHLTYAVGALADGKVEIVSVDGAGGLVRHRSNVAAQWNSARVFGDWLVLDSAPGADGKRTVVFMRHQDNKMYYRTFGADDRLILLRSPIGTEDLGYLHVSPATRTARLVSIYLGTVTEGAAHQLPAGVKLINRGDIEENGIELIDAKGKIYDYYGTRPPEPRRDGLTVPVGHPPALFLKEPARHLILAENTVGYTVTYGEGQKFQGPADRQPVWVGLCAGGAVCIIDELPGKPETRSLLLVRAETQQSREDVPYAAPRDAIDLVGLLFIRTLNGERPGAYVISNGKKVQIDGALAFPALRTEDTSKTVMLLRLPSLSTTPAQATLARFSMDGLTSQHLGSVIVRTAGCAIDRFYVACPGESDFTTWSTF